MWPYWVFVVSVIEVGQLFVKTLNPVNCGGFNFTQFLKFHFYISNV